MTPEWEAVPAHITQRLAIDAINAFCRSNSAPEGASGYLWHWVAVRDDRGDVTKCRVKLPNPPLIRRIKCVGHGRAGEGGCILRIIQSHLYIAPNWDLRGGAVSLAELGNRMQTVARVGWSEEYRIAVLFFANGGQLPGAIPQLALA